MILINRPYLQYVKEAIENQKLGKEIKSDRTNKKPVITKELQNALNKDSVYKNSFNNLNSGKTK